MPVFELNNQFYLLKRSLYKTGILPLLALGRSISTLRPITYVGCY